MFRAGQELLELKHKLFYLIINKTKAIEDNYLDTIENNKSKPRIPFGSLVELGILKPGTTLFDPKKKINAKIMADGSIKYKESEGSIHKVAATIMGAESYNGWTYWHCNINGSTVVIDSLRQKFISENKLIWLKDAEKELKKIPFFVRGKARKNTEKYAENNGFSEISIETLYEAKAHYAR